MVKPQDQVQPAALDAAEQGASIPASKAWVLLPVQVFLTGLITYVAIGAWTVIGGAYTEGLQVVGFAIASAMLTIVVFVVGIPLRIVPSVRQWWFRHAAWLLALSGIAAAGLLLSFFVGESGPVLRSETVDWPLTDGYEPDARLFFSSLTVLAFATMHLRPPRRR